MTLDQDTVLILVGIGAGLLSGLVATLWQIRHDPGGWRLLSREPVARGSRMGFVSRRPNSGIRRFYSLGLRWVRIQA